MAALNEDASLAALEVSEERAVELTEEAETIGRYLALTRRALIENGARVRRLLPAEQFRMWIVVIAGTIRTPTWPRSRAAALRWRT